MQETIDDKTYVFCDNCNPDWNPENDFLLPEAWAFSLGLPDGTRALRGVFPGLEAEAIADGWEEKEFGHLCQVCVLEERAAGETLAMSQEEALDFLVGLTPTKEK